MAAHSIIPPSSAGVWGRPGGCTGSVIMSMQYPETGERPDADEGEASHEIGAALIGAAARGVTPQKELFIGKPAGNGVIVDDPMFDAAEIYANDAAAVMRRAGVFGGPHLNIEKTLPIPRVHAEQFGTPDCWIYEQSAHHLHIWDYKYGYVIVEAFENWQALDYLTGVVDALGLNGLSDQNLKITITIAQPRAFHRDGPIRRWNLTGGHLRAYSNTLAVNACEALGPNPITTSGPQCQYCPAHNNCEAALKAGMTLYEVAQAPQGIDLSPQALGVQLSIVTRARKQLEYLEAGYIEQAKSLVKRGATVPGWAYEDAYGREKWAKPVKEVVAMGQLCKIDIAKPQDALTPKQARDAGVPDDVVRAYSMTPRAGIKLVPDNANRIKEAFSK